LSAFSHHGEIPDQESTIQALQHHNRHNKADSSAAGSPLIKKSMKTSSGFPPTQKQSNDNIVAVSPSTPKKLLKASDYQIIQQHFGYIMNDHDQHVLLAPLSGPQTELFSNMHQSYQDASKPYEYIDSTRALETEDDKEIDRFLSQGRAMMNLVYDPETQDWYNFFEQAYTSLEPEFTDPEKGDDIRDLGLNLTASAPLTMFDHTNLMERVIYILVAFHLLGSEPPPYLGLFTSSLTCNYNGIAWLRKLLQI
jgi:hypothetical protein